MKYIITNLSNQNTFEYEYPRNKEQLRSWLANSASTRADTELFREVAIYGVDNFRIETEADYHTENIEKEIKLEVKYKEVVDGKPIIIDDSIIDKFPEDKEIKPKAKKRTYKKRTKKK